MVSHLKPMLCAFIITGSSLTFRALVVFFCSSLCHAHAGSLSVSLCLSFSLFLSLSLSVSLFISLSFSLFLSLSLSLSHFLPHFSTFSDMSPCLGQTIDNHFAVMIRIEYITKTADIINYQHPNGKN